MRTVLLAVIIASPVALAAMENPPCMTPQDAARITAAPGTVQAPAAQAPAVEDPLNTLCPIDDKKVSASVKPIFAKLRRGSMWIGTCSEECRAKVAADPYTFSQVILSKKAESTSPVRTPPMNASRSEPSSSAPAPGRMVATPDPQNEPAPDAPRDF
ncbi:MAG: hypothetical protein H0U85_04310 [Gemmatimonadales bacterium]|nr:hypothetical protein [Gemmatimonadales bacterium]MBA3709313.1 hypothetical protein [Planctomycetota bacterium]